MFKKLIVKEFTVTQELIDKANRSLEVGDKYSYFYDEESKKYYRPKDTFIVASIDLEKYFEEVVPVEDYDSGLDREESQETICELLSFKDAVKQCKVRGYIRRRGVFRSWSKNHIEPLEKRVPLSEQKKSDWVCHDPEGPETSIVG
jgi:hypothetical protein